MSNSVAKDNIPWCLIGNLNEVVHNKEKIGDRDIWNKRFFLKDFIEEVVAIDLGFSG